MKLPTFRLFLSITACLILASGISFASASNIYIAQSAAGAANGSSCANAYAYTFFNASGNWGSGASQIGPGTTVHLCGTITSAITAQGSGSSGNPITILFDAATSGNITMPALPTGGALIITGESYITIDGNSQVGIIQSTSNGSSLSDQVCSVAIAASGTANIIVRELQILNVFVNVANSDDSAGGCSGVGPPAAVYFPNTTGNFTIDHVVCTYAASCFNGGGAGSATVSNSTCQNFDHCLGMGNQAAAQVWGPVYFYNNNVDGMEPWDSAGNDWHHDGIHLWGYCADGTDYCAGTYWNDIYIYNNWFHGDPGQNFNSWIYLEENNHNAWIFNNYFDTSARAMQNGAGPTYLQGTNITVQNNTFLGNSAQGVTNANMGGPKAVYQNNVNSTGQLVSIQATDMSGENSTTISALNHNYYMNGNSNSFVWQSTWLAFSQFTTWESDSGDSNSAAVSGSTVSESNGALEAGSPALGFGTNLYSSCSGQANPGLGALCEDASGNPRPTTGGWDAGAFEDSSVATVAPPTGLTATVSTQ